MRPAVSYPEIVGGVLKQIRTQLQLDQATIAKTVGVAQPTWSRIESGSVPITVEQLAFIAPQLKMSPSQILERADKAADSFRKQGIQVTPQRASPTGMDEEGRAFLKAAAVVGMLALIFGGK
jgi:transcriptional regulator with XRE-family HTH domain